jgi:hypothetical protein
VKPAPHPENIIWENMETDSSSKVIRRSLSVLFTILILFLVFIAQVWVEKEQDVRVGKYPYIECGNKTYTKQQAIDDYTLGD